MNRTFAYALSYANRKRQALGASDIDAADRQGIVDELEKHAMAGDEQAAGLLVAIGHRREADGWPQPGLTP